MSKMAPMNVSGSVAVVNGAGYSEKRRSVLMLDKGEHPFEEKISEACSILGIDLESLPSEFQPTVYTSNTKGRVNIINGPRYEWTLRWILSKLHGDIHYGNPCLLPRTWLLLQYLITDISPAKVAQLLSSNKYLDTLRRTLAWLRENSPASTTPSVELSSDSNSGEYRPSKKKRRNAAGNQPEEQVRNTLEHTSPLLFSICGTLFQVQCLMRSRLEASDSLVAEQLKFTLRCSPEEAASILGDCFYLLNHVSRTALRAQASRNDRDKSAIGWYDGTPVKSCAEILINFWSGQNFSGCEVDYSIFVSLRWSI